jgi:hypothetical protein
MNEKAPRKGQILLVLFTAIFSAGAFPHVANASSFLTSEGSNLAYSTDSVTCTLNGVVQGDVIYLVVQSYGVQQSVMTATDSEHDSFSYVPWDAGYELGGAYARAGASGNDSITTTMGNGGADLGVFCYAIGGVTTNEVGSTGSGSVDLLSVASFTPTAGSFIVGTYSTNGRVNSVSFIAGSGFNLSPGTPMYNGAQNALGSEYMAEGSGSTTCQMFSSAQQAWGGLCVAFAPIPYSISVQTNQRSYTGSAVISVSGSITPPPTTNTTGVIVTTTNSQGEAVDIGSTPVSSTTGEFTYTLVAGGAPSWTPGSYTVNATWGGAGTFLTAVSTFGYAVSDSVTAMVSSSLVTGSGSFTVLGAVTAASGSVLGTAVIITVKNPSGSIASITTANVQGAGSSGTFSSTILAGGTPLWIGGNYSVVASYGSSLGSNPATATASFFYASNITDTATLATTTPATQASKGGYNGVEVGYTSEYAQPLSALVWVVARNGAGQAVGIYVGSLTANPGQSVMVFVPTFSLVSGDYTATVFATTTSFVAISASSTVALTV